jgi:hypothetical protein
MLMSIGRGASGGLSAMRNSSVTQKWDVLKGARFDSGRPDAALLLAENAKGLVVEPASIVLDAVAFGLLA